MTLKLGVRNGRGGRGALGGGESVAQNEGKASKGKKESVFRGQIESGLVNNNYGFGPLS